MPVENVETNLYMMGIDIEKHFDGKPDAFHNICAMKYREMTLKMLSMLNYRLDEPVPDPLEGTVENWAASRVIEVLRLRFPTLCTYTKYYSEGTFTRQYALRDPSKSMDSLTVLNAVPQALIARYRRLV